MKVQSIYTSKILKKGLEFAAKNGSLFTAATALAFSTARPLMILATPKTDRENKEYAFTKSVSSTLIGYGLMYCASTPVARAVKNIIDNPKEYLKPETIKNLKINLQSPRASSKFNFATQLVILGVGLIIAVPKSILTCSLIPPIMKNLFNKKPDNENPDKNSNKLSFKGIPDKPNVLSKGIAKILDKPFIGKLAEKYHDSNFEQLIIYLTDIMATAVFMQQTSSSKGIKDDRKKPLIYNAGISTGLSVAVGYLINHFTAKQTDNFVKKFSEANKNSKELNTYLEGIRVAKPALILGTLYYLIIPLISTFMADKFDNKQYLKK